MKYIFISLICIITLLACKKENTAVDADNITPRTVYTDSLNGWVKYKTDLNGSIDVYFRDPLNGYCLFGDGIIKKSTDGGKTWVNLKQNTNFQFQFSNIFTTDNGYLFATSANYLYRFKNDVLLDSISFNELSDIYFLNNGIGYASTSNSLLKTTDYGKTWVSNKLKPVINSSTQKYNSLSFYDNSSGWIYFGENFYYSQNNDSTWLLSDTKFKGPQSVFSVSKEIVYVSDSLDIYKSINSGKSFTPLKRKLQNNSYNDIHFVSPLIGYYCNRNFIYKTTNGGTTWTEEVALKSQESIWEIHFTDANNGWACTIQGNVLVYKK